MARLVTSDGVQVNLFLDLDSNNTGEGTLLYGPKSQPEMDFIVQGFKDFRTNTEFNNRNKLVFHCHHEITVNISSITGANYPTSSNPYVVDSETQLYYVGDDLVLSTTGMKIYRIDLFKSASTNIDVIEDSMFDGDYNSLSNKPTIPADQSSNITDLTSRVSTLELGGGGDTGSFSPPEILWERTGTSRITWVGVTLNGYTTTTSPHMTDFLGKYGDYYKLEVHTWQGGIEEFFIDDIHTIANGATVYNSGVLNRTRGGAYGIETSVKMDVNGNMTITITGGSTWGASLQRILVHKNPLGGPSDISQLNDSTGLLSSGGGGGRVLVFNSSGTYNKPDGVVGLEILMVAGGAGGGYNAGFYSTFGGAKLATAGGDTFITGLPDGEKRVKGGQVGSNKWFASYLEYMSPPVVQSGGDNTVYNWTYTSRGSGMGQGGYWGNDGGAKYPWLHASSGGAGGGGFNVPPNTTSHTGKSLSGGCGASANLGYSSFGYSLDGNDWHFAAPLGGVAGYDNQDNTQTYMAGGKGTFSGGGGGAYGNTDNYYETDYGYGGGGGIGAGGGGFSGYWKQNTNGGWSGGFAGEHSKFIINVPSAAASYQIEVGAGGDGAASSNTSNSMSAGGGGQGIVIIKEISDLTISTP